MTLVAYPFYQHETTISSPCQELASRYRCVFSLSGPTGGTGEGRLKRLAFGPGSKTDWHENHGDFYVL